MRALAWGRRRQTKGESFFAIRRVDGEEIYGEFGWVNATGPNDWEAAVVDSEDAEQLVAYELVRMHVESIETRVFGDPMRLHEHVGDECLYCAEPWPCEWIREQS